MASALPYDDSSSQNSSTVIGFDFGMKRIGVAIGQAITGTSRPLKTLQAQRGEPDWEQLDTLIQEWAPDALIVGIPLNMDHSEQPITKRAKRFAATLQTRFHLPVHEVDERLTSVEARAQLFEEGGYKALSTAEIDSYAAKLIVEAWLRQPR